MNIYLNFDGQCREAFEFYRAIFGGEFDVIQTFGDAPPEAGMPGAVKDLIMHVSLPLEGATLMGSDVSEPGSLTVGNNFSISLSPESREACDRLFAALSEGGEVGMPMQETFWGSYFGDCKDRYQVSWMLNMELEQPG
jgi:PhnB protein